MPMGPIVLGIISSLFLQDLPTEVDFPLDLVTFASASEPLFRGTGPGHWDALIRERGWILREEGTYHLWFTGYVDKKAGPMLLGYATSPDGIHWTRSPGNPIYADDWVEDMQVVRDGDLLYMFAEGRGPSPAFDFNRSDPLDPRRHAGCSAIEWRADLTRAVRNADSIQGRRGLEPLLRAVGPGSVVGAVARHEGLGERFR